MFHIKNLLFSIKHH